MATARNMKKVTCASDSKDSHDNSDDSERSQSVVVLASAVLNNLLSRTNAFVLFGIQNERVLAVETLIDRTFVAEVCEFGRAGYTAFIRLEERLIAGTFKSLLI